MQPAFILFKAWLFRKPFKRAKAKSTACASKKNKTYHRKVFAQPFPGSTKLFEKYGGMYTVGFSHQGCTEREEDFY